MDEAAEFKPGIYIDNYDDICIFDGNEWQAISMSTHDWVAHPKSWGLMFVSDFICSL